MRAFYIHDRLLARSRSPEMRKMKLPVMSSDGSFWQTLYQIWQRSAHSQLATKAGILCMVFEKNQ